MISDIRGAAEFILQFSKGPARDSRELAIAEHADLVARAWLAEHPADDDEPIDRSWLAAIGGLLEEHPLKVTFYRKDGLPIGLWSVDDGWKVMVLHSEHAATCVVRGLNTRGDFRRLAEALEIETTQSSK